MSNYDDLQSRLDSENHACLSTSGPYWAVTEAFRTNPSHTFSENLIWETMHSDPRPPLHLQLFEISDLRGFVGYIDVEAHCLSLSRHESAHDVHPCINHTPGCFDVRLDVLSYTLHPMSDFVPRLAGSTSDARAAQDFELYLRDFDLFKRQSDIPYAHSFGPFREMLYPHLHMIYSLPRSSGRVTLADHCYNYIPTFLAPTDGLVPQSVLFKLAQSSTVIPDITTIPDDKVIHYSP